MKKVLVCGDRNWTNGSLIYGWLSKAKERGYGTVIEGEARGADSLARNIAKELEMEVLPFPADWEKFHKAAGPIRNKQMLDEGKPDLVLAFHDNIDISKGTRDMINQAKRAGIKVILINSKNRIIKLR